MKLSKVSLRGTAALVAAVLAGTMLSVLVPSPAQAKFEYHYWASALYPADVTGNGGEATGYGQWRVADSSNGTRSFFDAYIGIVGVVNNGAYAYGETQYDWGDGNWDWWAVSETPRVTTSWYWQWKYSNTDVPYNRTEVRGITAVCIDVSWQWDPCTGVFYVGPSSY